MICEHDDEIRPIGAPDWTMANGFTNSSPAYERLVDRVNRIIRGGAVDLIAGRSGQVARTVVSVLAHDYGMELPENGRARLERGE